jgi:phage gp16-like protein
MRKRKKIQKVLYERPAIMPVQKLLAKIHIAKKELGIEDSIYRDILYRKFRVGSSKSLSDSQALVLIYHFKALGWVPKSKSKKYDDLGKRDAYAATPAQLRMIEAMWHDIYRGNSETKHLRQFLFNHFKVSDIKFLERKTAHDVIEALKSMAGRRQGESPYAKAKEEQCRYR